MCTQVIKCVPLCACECVHDRGCCSFSLWSALLDNKTNLVFVEASLPSQGLYKIRFPLPVAAPSLWGTGDEADPSERWTMVWGPPGHPQRELILPSYLLAWDAFHS